MSKLKNLLAPLGLLLLEAVLFATNYVRGTFVMGWDNLMPEFDLALNFKRALVAVWQGYRGLGNLDGLGNAATLTHTSYIWFLSLFFSQNLLRYIFLFGTHLVGGLGLYFLAKKLTNNPLASFIAALFYMLNIGVIQLYFAPLEAFAIHFASLPWIALLTINALKNPRPRNLLLLLVTSFLFSSQGFIPTIFAVSVLSVLAIHASFLIKRRDFRTSLVVFLVFLAGNAFWLAPYSYSAIKTPAVIASSRINQFASEDIFYRNKAHGNLADVLRLKGFMIDTVELNSRGVQSGFFTEQWKNFTQTPAYNIISLSFLLLLFYGLFKVLKKKNYEALPFLISFLIAFFFLANDTPPFSTLNEGIRNIPFVGQVFRFPFTKFITLFAFSFSVILAFGIAFLPINRKALKNTVGILLILGILFLSIPAFRGNFFSPWLKTPLPKEYLQLMNSLSQKDPNQRVALFPVYTFWDWEYLGWGNIGSGFQWYGIPQAVLKRSFDPWSNYNEQFYNEISYAVNNQDQLNLLSVLKKYDVKYILLDQNIQNTLTRQPYNFDSLKLFLAKQPYLSQKQTFGRIILYEANFGESAVSSVDQSKTLTVNPTFNFEKKDNTFQTVGTYVKTDSNPDIIPLIPSVYSEKLQSDLEYNITETDSEITITSKKVYPKISETYTLEIPSLPQQEFLVPVDISVKDGQINFDPIYPSVFVNDKKISAQDVPIKITPQIVTNPTSITFVDVGDKVDLTKPNPRSYLMTSFPNSLVLSDGKREEQITFDTTLTNRSVFYVPVNLNGQINSVKVVIPKFRSFISYSNVLNEKKYKVTNPSFSEFRRSGAKVENQKLDGGIDLGARGTSNEVAFYLDNLQHSASYLMRVDSNYISGLPMNFYMDNPFESRAEAETQLSKEAQTNYIVLPKSENYYKGYGFHFTVKSLGNETAQSILKRVEIVPFPAEFLRNLRLVKASQEPIVTKFNEKNPISFTTNTLSSYSVDNIQANSYLVLSQAYDPGWQAYVLNSNDQHSKIKTFLPFIFGQKIKDHTLINNWGNGWKIDDQASNKSIVIIYTPQYFQYLGFAVIFISILYLGIRSVRK